MQVLCGQCGKVSTFDDAQAGQSVKCFHCGHAILIPDDKSDVKQPLANIREDEGFAAQVRSKTPKKLHIVCGSCGKHFTIGARRAGMTGKCPACNAAIQIPYPDDSEDMKLLHLEKEDEKTENQTEPADKIVLSPDDLPDLTPKPKQSVSHEKKPHAPQKPIEHVKITVRTNKSRNSAMRRKQLVRRRKKTNMLLALAMIGAILIGAAAFKFIPELFEPQQPKTPAGTSEQASDTEKTPATVPVEPIQKTTPPDTPPTDPPETKTREAKWRIINATIDLFANGGYSPALEGMQYIKVTTEVTATDSPLTIKTFGNGAVLQTSVGPQKSLGVATDKTLIPISALRTQVRIKPSSSRIFTLVFLVPQDARNFKLKIRSLASLKRLPLITRPKIPDASLLAGRFEEVAPRNLKPLLRDPVMAAIQQSHSQKLSIHASKKDDFYVRISPARVFGRAKSLGDGLYEIDLKHGQDNLTCKLRLCNGGKLLILYLKDEPFHQITYKRTTGTRNR